MNGRLQCPHYPHRTAKLLFDLSQNCSLCRFSRLHFSPRELPLQRQVLPLWPLGQQHSSILDNQGTYDIYHINIRFHLEADYILSLVHRVDLFVDMKCDICNKQATVYLTQIIKDQMTQVNLCESCSKEKGVTDTTGFGLAEAFVGPTSARPEDLACPACGFTQSQLKKIGRMGCPECYSTFRDGLEGLLAAMHKGTSHKGKTPRGKGAKLTPIPAPTPAPPAGPKRFSVGELRKMIAGLREKLQAAVAEERFEDAAKFKAEITSLDRTLTEQER